MKKLSVVCWALALILSHAMCADVAYTYCNMLWGIRYQGYSAPASTAFLLAIPYAVAVALCVGLALFFRRRAARRVGDKTIEQQKGE